MNYYNETNRWKAKQLRGMISYGKIPDGHVDERSIAEVLPTDLVGYDQCHFFAGIGGFSLALMLAGWPKGRRIWTGSCPCSPYSNAGKRLGELDPRDLWPVWANLIVQCKPERVIGEQVEAAISKLWLDRLCSDLEREGYSVGSVVLGAHSVGLPHVRHRLFWAADTSVYGREGIQRETQTQVSQDRAPETLGSWNSSCNTFSNWRKLMAQPYVLRVDDGVSSTLDIRPRLHAYGDAIVPQVAAEFIASYMDVSQ